VALSVLVSAWLVGALGGLHCLAMCGGFLAAAVARDTSAAPLQPAASIVRKQSAYHAGRVATYALLGAAFGAAGAGVLNALQFLPAQRALYLLANVFLLALGLSLAFGAPGIGWLQRGGATVFARVLPILRPMLSRPGLSGRVVLGLAWGVVPCALVYSVLPLALFAGGAWQGALVMLVFGIGTLPNLVAAGVVIGRAPLCVDRRVFRYASAALLAAFAMTGIYRVVSTPEALAAGAFCLVP
jgi:sulfite exporter TauE/SafE